MTTIRVDDTPVIVRPARQEVRFDETGPQVVVRPENVDLVVNTGIASGGTGSGHTHPVVDWTLTYDINGDLAQVDGSGGGGWALTYDGEGRLSTISDLSSTLVRTLEYDPDGRIESVSHSGA